MSPRFNGLIDGRMDVEVLASPASISGHDRSSCRIDVAAKVRQKPTAVQCGCREVENVVESSGHCTRESRWSEIDGYGPVGSRAGATDEVSGARRGKQSCPAQIDFER